MVGDTGEGTPLPRSCTGAHPSPAPLLPAEGVLGVSRYDGRADFAGMLILDSGGVPTTAPACPPVPTAPCPSPIPIAPCPSPCIPQRSHPVTVPPVAPSITLRAVTGTRPAAGAGAVGLPPRGGFLGGTILPHHQMSFLIV